MAAALCPGTCQSSTSPCPALPCCASYQCQVGAFSQCSTSCGQGVMSRAASCLKTCGGVNSQVSVAECNSNRVACNGDSQPCTICPANQVDPNAYAPVNQPTYSTPSGGQTYDPYAYGRRRRLLEAHSTTLNTVAGSDGPNALILSAGAMVVVALFASSVLIVRRAVDAGFKREVELLEVELLEAGSE